MEPIPTNGNPLVALAVAVIKAILYVLDSIRSLATWLTITLPGYLVRMLQYSFTISLGFPVLLSIFVGALVAATFVIRYNYLARYTQLKEPALPPPSPRTLTNELLPLAAVGLNDGRTRASPFHNYLDDFLAAIRIFGYLEKPVFHELSRHLQTRRLAAGETLEIGNGDFWCVVEGKVQVFAPSDDGEPSKKAGDSAPNNSFNGYHLLNEVSTGGTLSSLFSILSLFTEDIKLSWTPPPEAESDQEEEDSMSDAGETTFGGESRDTSSKRRSRANSDVSFMGEETMSKKAFDASSPPTVKKRSSSATVAGVDHPPQLDPQLATPSSNATSLPGSRSSSPDNSPSVEKDFSPPASSRPRLSRNDTENTQAPSSPGDRKARPDKAKSKKTSAAGLQGTIARATVDTTLAVIPAEAFRKLTRKYPKASGTVVQVVLERFSRVTFMTAHKYLGLTKEILKSESSLNDLVSHPLPREFYTSGGMQALRARFQPDLDPTGRRHSKSGPSSPLPRVMSRDYFNYIPASPTVRAPSLPSFTPKKPGTPAAGLPRPLEPLSEASPEVPEEAEAAILPGIGPMTSKQLSPEIAARHQPQYIRRASAMRKQVGAGDLAMSNVTIPDGDGAYYRPSARTPGLPRMDTWRGGARFPGSTYDLNEHDGVAFVPSPTEMESESIELRDAVLICIAKSIGLAQPAEGTIFDSHGRSSAAPSASGLSTPNSPMFPPMSNKRSSSITPFGNVLDMMNASADSDNLVGGMLREAVTSQGDDVEMSSVSASVQDSFMGGSAGEVNKTVLKDLEGNVEIVFFKQGSTLVKEGEKSPGIYYVIDGFLEVTLPVKGSSANIPASSFVNLPPGPMGGAANRPFSAGLGMGATADPAKHSLPSCLAHDEHLYNVKPGGIAGYLASLCGTESYVNITAKTDCFVGFLPHKALEKILERRPIVLLTLSKRLISLLSPLVLHIDAALDWMQLSGGQVLYEKGDRSSDFYIVINGRLRSLSEKGESVEVLREYGQNDSIGELDVITSVARSDTVHAIRDSELVRIPAALFDAVSAKHPNTTVQFMRLIAGRVRRVLGERSLGTGGQSGNSAPDVNLKTVCILGTNRNVPVAHFAGKLKTSLEELGATTSYLDQGTVIRHLGRHAFARIGKLKVAGWLADQEQHYRTVLYVADTPASSQWTLTCIRQADLVLVLGMGDDPAIGEYEKLLLATKTTARKELILLHDERTVAPGSTRPWLKNRPWLHAHHHVELPGVVTPHKTTPTVHDPAAIAAFKHLREQVGTRIKKYRGLRPIRARRPAHMNDFARIARRLCDKQIGLVLGGGGGRGIAHIGFLQALEEMGIPVDAISGCSIGAFVGGLYCKEADLLECTGRTKQFAGRMSSMIRILSDVTYPFVAYTTGHEFNRGIYKAFYNTHIEDCWIPFFCNSTNITHSRMEVHRSGYAWRYVRASMTLAGLLPPLSDNGNLLVDGGYIDNTPIEPLRTSGIRDIMVIDVGSLDDTSPRNYGDSVSGWWILLNKFNPFYERNVLSMTEISGRLAYVSSVKTLEDVKSDPHCLYLAMPIQQFDTIGGFKQFKEVMRIGLEAGREALKEWKDKGKLPSGLVDDKRGQATVQRGNRLRRMSI